MDGNNSLKRVGKVGDRDEVDTRVFTQSDYYLSDTYVERFANEVKARHTAAATQSRTAGTTNTDTSEGDPTDGAPSIDDIIKVCVKNWKAASDDDKKRMWSAFDESGIFASACRHGLLLWIIDMVRSGEL